MPDVSPLAALKSLIEKKQATVGIIGLGYVGLPLAHAFIEAGFNALGYDVDQQKIEKLNKCERKLHRPYPFRVAQELATGRSVRC